MNWNYPLNCQKNFNKWLNNFHIQLSDVKKRFIEPTEKKRIQIPEEMRFLVNTLHGLKAVLIEKSSFSIYNNKKQ